MANMTGAERLAKFRAERDARAAAKKAERERFEEMDRLDALYGSLPGRKQLSNPFGFSTVEHTEFGPVETS